MPLFKGDAHHLSAARSKIASFLKCMHDINVYRDNQPWKFHQILTNCFGARAIHVLIYAYIVCKISQKPFKRFAYTNNENESFQIL